MLQSKEEMQDDFERQISIIKQNHSKITQELGEEYSTKYHEDAMKIEKSKEEKEELVTWVTLSSSLNHCITYFNSDFEETKRQIEEDAENELDEMRDMYETKLNVERQMVLRLKGESNIMRKRYTSLQKDIEEHKEVWVLLGLLVYSLHITAGNK